MGIESLDSVSDPSISDLYKRFGAPAPENSLSVDGLEVRFLDHNLRELVALRYLPLHGRLLSKKSISSHYSGVL